MTTLARITRHRLGAEAAEGQADQEVVPDRGDLQDQHDDQDVAATSAG